MGELLVKPYEISVWEEKLTQNGFEEIKLAVIGSNTMSGPNKVYEPVFNKKANGEKTLTFSLKYKYFDPYSGNDEVINPFVALLVNERKVKLHYNDEWYEFIVKDHNESDGEYTWTYTCTDAFVLELSKNGYNLEFSSDLNNNQGTARELAKKTLQDTDWQLGGADNFRQLIEEPVYLGTLVDTSVNIINTDTGEPATFEAGAQVYVFYSYIKNQNGKFVQFIIHDENRSYTIDDKNVITDTNYRILDELTFKDNGFYSGETPVLLIEETDNHLEIETRYHVNRLAYGQLTTYDPVMGKTVERFKIQGADEEVGDREVYKYTDYLYTTSTVVMNYIVNGDNFNALEDGSLQGWNPYTDVKEGYEVNKLNLVTRPELGINKKLADVSTLSQIEGFLEVKFNGPREDDDENHKIYNTVYNKGISGTSTLESISAGEEFLFRWRAGIGELEDLQPYDKLRMIVAKYEQDEPTRYGYYYKHIDPDDIIVEFDSEVKVLNNYVRNGIFEEIIDEETGEGTGKYNYVIDGAAQTPSTKYIYVITEKDENEQDYETYYIWDGETGDFKPYDSSSNDYLPYYYVTGKATRAVSPKELTHPEDLKDVGIFIYATDGEGLVKEVSETYSVNPEESEESEEEPTTGESGTEPATNEGEGGETPSSDVTPTPSQSVTEVSFTFEPLYNTSFTFECNGHQFTGTAGQAQAPIESENFTFEYKEKTNTIIFTNQVNIESYTITYNTIQPIYIQDIQFTRYIPDGSEPAQPVLIGNLPKATSNPVDHYYLKPESGMTADDVEVYTDEQAFLEDLDIGGSLVPLYNDTSEKNLSITASQSNCFNVLQTIAETFECWIDLVVEHDDRGAIVYEDGVPQKFVYLREYAGKENWAGFKYAVNLESIERTINSDEFVTKLIVDQSQSDYTDEGYISIANAPSNQTGESYILNFDYYYSQGLLDREETESDKNEFIERVSDWNRQITEKQTEQRTKELALVKVESNRTVYSELVNTAKEEKSEALADFYELTNLTYDEYRQQHNEELIPTETDTPEEAAAKESEQLTGEETIVDLLGKIYITSATINNYGGILSNIDQQYWELTEDLEGYGSYIVKIWVDRDDLDQRHVFVEFSDYLEGITFNLGEGDLREYSTGVNQKYFDITSTGTVINFEIGQDSEYKFDSLSYPINDKKITKIKFTLNEEGVKEGLNQEIQNLIEDKAEYVKEFNNKYRRFIQEGTWNSTDYIDPELYYLDALQVSNTSAQPVVSYTINVVEISQLEGYENYLFDAGDKTYVEDTEFFGWANKNGVLTPAREEVIVSEVEWHLDEPDKNVITVQNYKSRFEDFFQRVNAAVQTVQYNEATYAKISTLLDANGTINQDVLLTSLNRISGQNYNLTSDGSILIDGPNILIRNLTNEENRVILNNEGIKISSDGGQTWRTAIDGQGINIGTVYTGMLNTNSVVIGSEDNPSFRWDKSGISAYKSNSETGVYDLQTYVRYDEYGLYGVKEGGSFKAKNLEDVLDKAHFAVTWDGFFIKNSYEDGGRVSITSDNDFQVIDGNEVERVKIGSLGVNPLTNERIYGINISNQNGDSVLSTNNNGDLTISGTIYANAGEIGGMSVNNDRLRMDYIVFRPGTGIYSIYPNQEESINDSISAYPFWISDTDGSAIFNNVTVRGSIKTSVFEYEEIQAVGGAFLFRPSSTIHLVERDGQDLIFTVEKFGLFKEGSWLKISNYSSETVEDIVTPDELNGFGLTYIYPIPTGGINGRRIRLTGAAEIIDDNVATLDSLCGGSLIDMGNQAGTSNYGIGINSSDGFINLPPRAISLFETVIHSNQDPKVSYSFRGILGTLPSTQVANISVDSSIYNNMAGTQGIYTDNMYIGDLNQYIAFYEDGNGNKQLKIKANQIMFEVSDPEPDQDPWKDITDIAEGTEGKDAIQVEIDSTAGVLFVNDIITSTLICTVKKGGVDITNDSHYNIYYTWKKRLLDGSGYDPDWGRPLEHGNRIDITSQDVENKGVFECEVIIQEV